MLPDTFNFMLIGYGIILGSLGCYILSLAWRWRRLKRQQQELAETLEKKT